MIEYRPIERADGISPEAFQRDYLAHNRPVVLTGIAVDGGSRWTPERWADEYGDVLVEAESDDEIFFMRRKSSIPLRRLVEMVQRGSLELRFRDFDFLRALPALEAEFERTYRAARYLGHVRTRGTYMAPAGNLSAFHHDFADNNLNVQIFGRKRFWLAPPAQYELLEPLDFGFSGVNPVDPDVARFPRFSELAAHVVTCELRAGEALYIPRYWWHLVRAEEPSINVVTITSVGGLPPWRATAGIPSAARLAIVSQTRAWGALAASALRAYRRYRPIPPLVAGGARRKDGPP